MFEKTIKTLVVALTVGLESSMSVLRVEGFLFVDTAGNTILQV